MLRAPIMRSSEQKKLVRLQRQLVRCRKGSVRRGKVKARIANVHVRVADRRKDWVEKTTTRITATYGMVAIEKLPMPQYGAGAETETRPRQRRPLPRSSHPGELQL